MKDNRIDVMRATQVAPKDFPAEFFKAMTKWDMVVKSPYGNSFYSAQPDWNYKKPNSLRISDHWNFSSQGKLHCQTVGECPNDTHWTIAKFDGELQKYVVIHSIPKNNYNNREKFHYHMIRFNGRVKKAFDNINIKFEGTPQLKEALSKCELGLLNTYYQILQDFK